MTRLLTTTTALVLATGMAFAQESGSNTSDPANGTKTGGMGSGMPMGMAGLSTLPEACRTAAVGNTSGSLSGTATGASDSAGTATSGSEASTTDTTATDSASFGSTTEGGSADTSPDSTDPAASTDGTGTETATAETLTTEGTGNFATATQSGGMMAGGMGSAMMTMHGKMMAVQGITDPNFAFACTMITHHQGAIEMAQAMEAQIPDEELNALAQTMITSHQTEIDALTSWVEKHGASGQ